MVITIGGCGVAVTVRTVEQSPTTAEPATRSWTEFPDLWQVLLDQAVRRSSTTSPPKRHGLAATPAPHAGESEPIRGRNGERVTDESLSIG